MIVSTCGLVRLQDIVYSDLSTLDSLHPGTGRVNRFRRPLVLPHANTFESQIPIRSCSLETRGCGVWLPDAGLQTANGISFVVLAFELHKLWATLHIHLLLNGSHRHTLQVAQTCIAVLHTTAACILKRRENIFDVRGKAEPWEPGLHTRKRVRAHRPLVLSEADGHLPEVVEEDERTFLSQQCMHLSVALHLLEHVPLVLHFIQDCRLHLFHLCGLSFHQEAGRSLRRAAQIQGIEFQFQQARQCCMQMIPGHVRLDRVGCFRKHQYLR